MKLLHSVSTTILLVFLLGTIYGSRAQQTAAKKSPSSIKLASHGFNAKKRSGFVVNAIDEKLERGLTLVHFNSPNTFEFKGFDTYSSSEALEELVEHLRQMLENNTVFALLAHDSAVKGALSKSDELNTLGLSKLSALKGRQAYVMFHANGEIQEFIDDTSVNKTILLPLNLKDEKVYFPKIKYAFEPNNDRYIAHAGGEVKGIKSTNSKEALDENYKKGFRLFELDIIKTADGKLVAAHDWKMWARFTDFTGALPPTHKEFMKHKIYGDYTTLDMKGINDWFAAHPDAILVTDKLNDPVGFASKFVDKSRLLMELFSQMSIDEASANGVNVIISQEPLFALVGDKINYLKVNNIKYAAVSRRIIRSQTKFLNQLREHGIKVYVYNVNFDPGKDEKYVYDNELGLVYGMYADKWVFD